MADPEIELPRTSSDLESGGDDIVRSRHKETEKLDGSVGATPRTSSRSSIDNNDTSSIEWLYLTWDAHIPSPAIPTSKHIDHNVFPSTSTYEQYTSPFTWSEARKRFITWLSCAATVVTAYTAGSYTAGDEQLMAYWHVSHVVITVGVTVFTCGFAIAPMILAPFSEINGRRPVFVAVSYTHLTLPTIYSV